MTRDVAQPKWRIAVIPRNRNACCWVFVVSIFAIWPTLTRAGDPSEAERKKMSWEAIGRTLKGSVLCREGKYREAVSEMRAAAEIREKLYPESKFPDGHEQLAVSFNNLGFALAGAGDYWEAIHFLRRGLAMQRKLFPISRFKDGHNDIARSQDNLGRVLQEMGAYHEAQGQLEEALAMRRRLFPATQYPNGFPDLVQSLGNLAVLLETAGAYEQALPFHEEAHAMCVKLYPESKFPDGHFDLATSLNNLGGLYWEMGSFERALTYHERSVAMHRKLYPKSKYPKGHEDLASSLFNLGTLLNAIGSPEKGLPYCQQSLKMYEQLLLPSEYPDGHPDLVNALSNVAMVQDSAGQSPLALPHAERAYAMSLKLYPESEYTGGHPSTARCLKNLGAIHQKLGRLDEAVRYSDKALAMQRKLYPPAKYPAGHPDLVESLNSVSALRIARGSPAEAMPLLQEALAVRQLQIDRALTTASESDALGLIRSLPMTLDYYLTASRGRAGTEAAAYRGVWNSKAAVSRVLEIRHAAARATDTELAAALAKLRDNRRQTERLLQADMHSVLDSERRLADLADERDRLERELARALPLLARSERMAKLGPTDLSRILPPGSILIDFVRYVRFEFGAGLEHASAQKRVPSYAAFVLSAGQPAKRIDLGDAAPIDTAINDWRRAIEARETTASADTLARLVWTKLAPFVLEGTRTVYIAPDGNLARLPWAALPIAEGRVLLEDFSISMVPHGPFLLEALQSERKNERPDTVFALGGLKYSLDWQALPGTAVEVRAIRKVAPAAPITLEETAATAAKVAKELSRARWAHLATHGEFRGDKLAAEQKTSREALANWREGSGNTRRVAARNPLAFVGLVLSNGEVMSGLSILDLNLDNLKLVTLSACETGLGEYTGGKGVENLQMAFHLAGAQNVVASLWSVNDAATAALMAKFYHELWFNKREPLAALREAQLTIYRHPELIPDLAGERGAPKLKEAVAAKTTGTSPLARHADTKLWAAFVLSGAGK